MTPRRAALLPLLLLLAGCGGDPTTPVGDEPVPTAELSPSDPRPPHWPAKGCDTRSRMSQDFVPGARGTDTLEEALAPYLPDGGTVVTQPARPHRNASYLMVTQDNVIVAAVGAFEGDNGWLVDTVEKCAD